MLKRIAVFLAALTLSAALCGCGAPAQEEDPLDRPVPSAQENEEETFPSPGREPEETAAPEETPAPEPVPALIFDEAALEEMPHREEYLRLHALNKEVTGWLTVPNTQIDYAVALGGDNDYYLSHTLEGENSKSGAIFFDYRTDEALSCRHLIVYGHNMKAGTMFHDLGSYKHKDFFENNRIITLWAGSEQRQYEVYADFIAPEDVYFIREKFQNDQHFLEYMAQLRQYSKFPTDTVLEPDDQILTLVTCTYEEENARFVVQARRIA